MNAYFGFGEMSEFSFEPVSGVSFGDGDEEVGCARPCDEFGESVDAAEDWNGVGERVHGLLAASEGRGRVSAVSACVDESDDEGIGPGAFAEAMDEPTG
jgi:hypothetical protein